MKQTKKEEIENESVVDFSPHYKSVVPICSICHCKTAKQPSGQYQCTICQRLYDAEREIVEYPDTIKSSHDDEFSEVEGIAASAAGSLMVDNEPNATEGLYKEKRMLGVRPDERVIDYEIYFPDE